MLAVWLHSFNPRPRTGGDSRRCGLGAGGRFQSTPPHGGRPVIGPVPPQSNRFNPRPRTGGDTARAIITLAPIGFNPRPRTGGDWSGSIRAGALWCFNPRPRTGGDGFGFQFVRPAVFQSTPPHGGRPWFRSSVVVSKVFQSTPPHGGRPLQKTITVADGVSIHAPARGATVVSTSSWSCQRCFNPRPRTGGDQSSANGNSTRFQSTPPHGGRRLLGRHSQRLRVSIHAPARGATSQLHLSRPLRFNPRPRTGGDANM